MMTQFEKIDNKWKAICEGAGYIIYLACNETAQDLIKKVEALGLLSLDKNSENPRIAAWLKQYLTLLPRTVQLSLSREK